MTNTDINYFIEKLADAYNKGTKCLGALILLIFIELLFIIVSMIITKGLPHKWYKKIWSIFKRIILFCAFVLLLFTLPHYFEKPFEVLHKTQSLSIVFGIFSFGVSNVLFDIPSWREGMSGYSLTELGKRSKYLVSLSILAFTVGIGMWQHVVYSTNPSINILFLIINISFFGFLPIIIVMGIVDLLQLWKWLFKKIYKKEQRVYYLKGKKFVRKDKRCN